MSSTENVLFIGKFYGVEEKQVNEFSNYIADFALNVSEDNALVGKYGSELIFHVFGWRSKKITYEEIIKEYFSEILNKHPNISGFFEFYNMDSVPYSSFNYRTGETN